MGGASSLRIGGAGCRQRAAEKRLQQLGWQRAGQLYRWLLELDLTLNGNHSPDDRARWVLEELVLRMAKGSGGKVAQPASR